MNYATRMGSRPADAAVLHLTLKLGNCYEVKRRDPLMKAWHQHGYDSAFSADGVNGEKEEYCIADATGIQVHSIQLVHPREAAKLGFEVRSGRLTRVEGAAEEARRKAAEEGRRKEEEARRQAAEEARRKAAEEARRKEEEARRQTAENAVGNFKLTQICANMCNLSPPMLLDVYISPAS